MVKTFFEQGRQSGQVGILVILLEKRFGPIDETTRNRLESWSPGELEELGAALLNASSLKELGLED